MEQMEIFNRHFYYSQTEICKKYKISVPKFKALAQTKQLPVISFKANLGLYEVNTLYYTKEDIEGLNLPLR